MRSAAAILCGTTITVACLADGGCGGTDGRVEVTTARVTIGDITRQILTSGSLEPVDAVQIGAQVSGTILSVEVGFNAPVRTGQVIARFDPAPFEAELAEARAALADAEAALAGAGNEAEAVHTELARIEALAADGVVTHVDLQAARLAARLADAEVNAREGDPARLHLRRPHPRRRRVRRRKTARSPTRR